MPRIVVLASVVCLLFLFHACGGGGSGGSSYSVSFSVQDGDTEVGPGSYRTLTAHVKNPDGNPASRIEVSFRFKKDSSGASLDTVNSVTNADGNAEAIYQAGQSPGTDIVEVKAAGSKATISLRVAGGGEVVQTVVLSADPEEVDIGGYSTITVEGRTHDDQPAAGSQVEFSFQANNSGGSFILDGQEKKTLTKSLDSNGRAEVTYRAGSSSGQDVILAAFPQSFDVQETISITVGQGKALGEIRLRAFKSAEPTEWTIQAIVRDRQGNLAPTVLVNFNANNGNLSELKDPGTNYSSVEVETNANGIAEALLTDTYWATIYARVENVEHEVDVTVDEYFEAGSVELIAPKEVESDSVLITARVKDRDNMTMVDIPVRFRVDHGTLDPANAQTDIYGDARTTLTVQETGEVRVWANVGNISVSDVISIDMRTEPEPASIELSVPDTSEASTASIRAVVLDEDGDPIPDFPVSFFADKGILSSTNVTTDANGNAIAELTVENSVTVQITVSAGSITKGKKINFNLPESEQE